VRGYEVMRGYEYRIHTHNNSNIIIIIIISNTHIYTEYTKDGWISKGRIWSWLLLTFGHFL
jgi:hypothetical protein